MQRISEIARAFMYVVIMLVGVIPMLVFVLTGRTPSWVPIAESQQGAASRMQGIADVTVTGTATTLDAASSNRIKLSCTNNDPGVNIRVSSTDVTTTKGQRVGPGSAFSTTATNQIQAISEGANVTVSCTREVR